MRDEAESQAQRAAFPASRQSSHPPALPQRHRTAWGCLPHPHHHHRAPAAGVGTHLPPPLLPSPHPAGPPPAACGAGTGTAGRGEAQRGEARSHHPGPAASSSSSSSSFPPARCGPASPAARPAGSAAPERQALVNPAAPAPGPPPTWPPGPGACEGLVEPEASGSTTTPPPPPATPQSPTHSRQAGSSSRSFNKFISSYTKPDGRRSRVLALGVLAERLRGARPSPAGEGVLPDTSSLAAPSGFGLVGFLRVPLVTVLGQFPRWALASVGWPAPPSQCCEGRLRGGQAPRANVAQKRQRARGC